MRNSNKRNASSVKFNKSPKKTFLKTKNRIVVGINSSIETLRIRPNQIVKAILKEGWHQNSKLKKIHELLKLNKINNIEIKSTNFLDNICKSHQGVYLEVKENAIFNFDDLKRNEKMTLLVLSKIEDPHNLGAIIRTSWLMGVKGIFIEQNHSVGLSPSVNKVACGGIEHVPVIFYKNIFNLVDDFKKQGFWIYGLDASGDSNIFDISINDKNVLIVGSENHRLKKGSIKLCDEVVKIPQKSNDASYNVSIAVAIALTFTIQKS